VYALTPTGEQFINDVVPTLVRKSQALGAILQLHATLDHRRADNGRAVKKSKRSGAS